MNHIQLINIELAKKILKKRDIVTNIPVCFLCNYVIPDG